MYFIVLLRTLASFDSVPESGVSKVFIKELHGDRGVLCLFYTEQSISSASTLVSRDDTIIAYSLHYFVSWCWY